ncbi:MAG TPA: oxalate/formate MFS antiporter [Stellaceae bacterium]|nr:oxalate/formate MFS antiporter [Stellaceae bacterium]
MTVSAATATQGVGYRWGQLGLGLVVMMSISSPQYTWALFTGALTKEYGVTLAVLQWAFSLLIILQTFLSPLQASLVERFGARALISTGAVMAGASWMLSAYATNVWMLYLTYGVVGGFGTGIVYVGIIGLMVRWFPDRRGFATGLAAAGYGVGAILTTFPISDMLPGYGYAKTWLIWGAIQAVIGFAAALGLRSPPEAYHPVGVVAVRDERQSRRSYTPSEMLKSPIFYLLFIMMTMMSTGGLMVVSNVGAFAKQYNVGQAMVLGMAALPLSLSLSRATNGLTRPFFGWVSDHIGRENTMGLAFFLEAIAILVMFAFIDKPAVFVVMTGLVFFGWGEIFSLFPSTLTDTFGAKFASTNYGFLYIAQGVGSILGGPAAAWLQEMTGNWTAVFFLVAILDATTAFLALTALKRMRHAHLQMG